MKIISNPEHRSRYRVGGIEYVRYGPRDWRYADDEEIQVPGGRDMRLSERFNPTIGTQNGEKTVVLIDSKDIEEAPDVLNWALLHGTPIRGENGEVLQVLVPYSEWEEHDEISDVMIAPELDDDEGVRGLAALEVQLRRTERQLAKQTKERDALLIELSEGGMTRQRAAEITGMSVGKVQQIVKSEELASNEEVLVGILLEKGPLDLSVLVGHAKETPGIAGTKTKIKKILTLLKNRGIAEVDPQGRWRVTEKGQSALKKLRQRDTAGQEDSEAPSQIDGLDQSDSAIARSDAGS